MEAKPQSVQIYESRDGARPFEAWLRKLRDSRARQKIRARIARVRLGNFGDLKSVGQGVAELRVQYGPGYRIYIGRDGEETVILLIAGDKRTQDADIQLAKDYWIDYKTRKKSEPNGDN